MIASPLKTHAPNSNQVRVEEYEKDDCRIFAVYFRNGHWKRMTHKRGAFEPFWATERINGDSVPITGRRAEKLENLFLRGREFPKVQRFPRLAGLQGDIFDWSAIPRFDPSITKRTRWLIDSFITERNIQLVFGERGSFKSTPLIAAAKAVASGEKFLGMKTRRRRVVYLDYEDPANVLKTRNTDFDLNLPHNENLVIWDRFTSGPPPRPDDPRLKEIVRDRVAQMGLGPWFIFDSWSSLLKIGEGGEFTGQIAPIYLHLRELADLGATITVLDHSRKYERGTLYGGQDKEAKVDSIHNLLPYENKTGEHTVIIRVQSWLKRSAPKGEGTFAFEVLSEQDRRGEWHIRDLVRVEDPEIEEERMNTELMQQLIRTNPSAGQEKLARLAAEQGLPRDQAITLLKGGIAKHWDRKTLGHNKYRYTVK